MCSIFHVLIGDFNQVMLELEKMGKGGTQGWRRTGDSLWNLNFLPSTTVIKKEVSEQEIKMAMFQMRGLKASGPDGLPPCFFQTNWDTVGTTVVDYEKKAFSNGEFLSHMNESLISLIPKQEGLEIMSQFGPIALCNITTKLITKVLEN